VIWTCNCRHSTMWVILPALFCLSYFSNTVS
jgi:hypothetical protein